MRRILGAMVALLVAGAGAAEASAPPPSLRGSPAAMQQQNRVAKQHGLTFYRTPAQIRAGVAAGELVVLEGNADYEVADFVRYPYAHEALRLFIERLAAQYREACGQRLVVTSAVRPTSGQPSNAHALSVHPAGMAVDLRVSDRAACRSWLETALLNLERRGVLNGIREFRPPHYHVAVFPEPYLAYVQERLAAEAAATPEPEVAQVEPTPREAVEAFAGAELASALTAAPADEPSGHRSRRPLTALFAVAALPFAVVLVRRGRRS